MKIIIHKEDFNTKRIFFLHKKEKPKKKYFSEIEKKKAIGQYNLSKRHNAELHEEKRQQLMKHLFDSFIKNPPSWDSFKFNPL